ncbi:MAG: hypothetical protein RSA63_12275, partial [Eubacterium sp.]
GLNTYLGVTPYVAGSPNFMKEMSEGLKEYTGAGFVFETDPMKMVDLIMEDIEDKRVKLGI